MGADCDVEFSPLAESYSVFENNCVMFHMVLEVWRQETITMWHSSVKTHSKAMPNTDTVNGSNVQLMLLRTQEMVQGSYKLYVMDVVRV